MDSLPKNSDFVPTDITSLVDSFQSEEGKILLPKPNVFRIYSSKIKKLFNKLNWNYFKKWQRGRIRYVSLSILDTALILLILLNGIKPAQRLISPLVTKLQTINHQINVKKTKEVFSFAPSLAQNKFDNIDFNGLNILAFFDVPIDDDGALNHDSRGYNSLISSDSQDLFQKAHSYNTKIVLTTTLMDNDSIAKFLDDPSLQQNFITDLSQVIKDSNLDGLTVDFEPDGQLNDSYETKFSQFISKVNDNLHKQNPSLIVAVVVPSSINNNQGSFYDLGSLSKNSDKLFVMASDYIVPETKAGDFTLPVYGFGADYWKNLTDHTGNFFYNVPNDKLVLERAWYGNGDNYPLYKPSSQTVGKDQVEPGHVFLDNETINRLVRGVPEKARDAAKKNIPLVGNALKDEGILDSNVLAYALATIEHETDGTFEPVSEIQGKKSARRLGYEGGTNFYGRGFIQLTHLRNYRVMGERIGMGDRLAKNPDLASDPKVAAKILAAFFKDNNIANLASRGYYIAARQPINPDLNARLVASIALKYNEEYQEGAY